MKKCFFLVLLYTFFVLQMNAQTTTGRDMINGMERPIPANAQGGDWVSREGFRIFALDVEGPPSMQRQWFVQYGHTVVYRHHISYDSATAAERAAAALSNGFTREFGNPTRFGTELIWATDDWTYMITLKTTLDEQGRFNSVNVKIQRFL